MYYLTIFLEVLWKTMNTSVSKAGVPLRFKLCIFYPSPELFHYIVLLGTTDNLIITTGLILNTCLGHHQYPRQNWEGPPFISSSPCWCCHCTSRYETVEVKSVKNSHIIMLQETVLKVGWPQNHVLILLEVEIVSSACNCLYLLTYRADIHNARVANDKDYF